MARKIPIVKSSWITENYQIWLRGDDVDVQNVCVQYYASIFTVLMMSQSVQDHRLPVFSGVVVCPSGITDITRRTEICKLVTAHQGSYAPKLERPVKVTHLLCSGDEETDKMRLAEKFKTRGEADIQLVWEEWFWDSLHYGGRFDEAPYHVRNPRPEPRAHIDCTYVMIRVVIEVVDIGPCSRNTTTCILGGRVPTRSSDFFSGKTPSIPTP